MAYFGKTFKHEKDENFEPFVDTLGLPADRASAYKTFKSTQKLLKDGDNYTLITTSPGGEKELKFKSGVTFDETVAPDYVAKTTITVNGNTVTQVQKYPDGRSLTFKRDFTDDKLVLTITSSFWDGTAYRYFSV